MPNIAIFYNKKASIKPTAEAIIDQIKKNGYQVSVERTSAKTELALALGGDGTFIRVAHKLKDTPIPLLAVKLGKLGFLAECEPKGLLHNLKLFFDKKYTLDPRSFLHVSVISKGTVISTENILNDAVLSRQGISRLIDIDILSGKKRKSFRADGVIISTATGSTAYNLSAGGTIIHPQAPI